MRILAIGAALAVLSATRALAAVPPPPPVVPAPAFKDYASSAEVQALIETAKAKRTTEAVIIQPLLRLAPYGANLEYRAAVAPASVHEHEAEMFYVIKGAGVLITGGKLVDETRANPANLSGTAVAGGSERKVSAGDFIIVPENTPHWFGAITDGPLVLMSIHMPRN